MSQPLPRQIAELGGQHGMPWRIGWPDHPTRTPPDRRCCGHGQQDASRHRAHARSRPNRASLSSALRRGESNAVFVVRLQVATSA